MAKQTYSEDELDDVKIEDVTDVKKPKRVYSNSSVYPRRFYKKHQNNTWEVVCNSKKAKGRIEFYKSNVGTGMFDFVKLSNGKYENVY